MQKILGLDIGSYSIKAVEIVNTFKTYKVTRFYEVVVPEIEHLDPSLIGVTALKQLFSEQEIEVDKIFTSMMGLLVSMRILELPNVKKRNVPVVVQGELETQTPLSIEDAVIDQQILESKDGRTTVLAILARRDHVEAYLNGLKDLGVEPKVIDVDYLAYMNLYPYFNTGVSHSEPINPPLPKKQRRSMSPGYGHTHMVLDIGHLKTSLVIFQNGKLAGARTIRMAGSYFTDLLQKTLKVTYGEAQRLKHYVSAIEYKGHMSSQNNTDSRETLVAKTLALAVGELTKEIIRTLHSFKAQDLPMPEKVILCGGSAAIENLTDYLSEALEIPVERASFTTGQLILDLPEHIPDHYLAQSLGIALRGTPSKSGSQINLRKGELALVGSYDGVIRQISTVGLLVASLLICLIGSFGMRWWLYNKKIKGIQNDYRKEVIQLLKTEPKNLKNIAAKSSWDLGTYSTATAKVLQEEIKNTDLAIANFTNRKSASPLRILDDLSKAIPKDVKIDVTNFSVQDQAVMIEGETDSFSTSEKILTLIKSVGSLKNVERKSQENKPGSDGKIVKFSISAVKKDGF